MNSSNVSEDECAFACLPTNCAQITSSDVRCCARPMEKSADKKSSASLAKRSSPNGTPRTVDETEFQETT